MTNPSPYVARKPLRFGDRTLQPGESVPVEPGRDYRLMLRLGQIIEIPHAAAVAQATQAAPFPEDSTVFFVGEDGAYSLATFHILQEAPEDVRLDLQLLPGAQVALVTFADDQESTFVLPDSLLPEQPTQRLIDDLSGREEGESAQPTEPLPLGYTVLWVNEDGSHQQVTFEGMALAAELQRLVTFEGPEAEFERAGLSGPSVLLARVRNELLGVQQVSLLDLLPGEAAQRLLAFERRMTDDLGSREKVPAISPWREGALVVWVNADGAPQLMTFEGLDNPGDVQSARVRPLAEEGQPEPGVQQVRLEDLMPGAPATRLLAFEQNRVAEAAATHAQFSEVQLALTDKLEGRIAFLELLVKAVRENGEVIPDDFPAADQLAQNGVETLPGLRILADGENGRANLMALEAIGAGRADKILAALATLAEPPTPEG